MKFRKATLSAAALVLVAGMPAWADDRPPTPAEQAQIERVLRNNGFVSWEKIEFETDDGLWEVDDARTKDGREFDLKLQPGTLKIIRKTPG